ncbi:2-oxoacid dehydrogenases acyltransferase-domain-containing protein [Crepidotus variabilis]|uniref:Dihydrolipoamide acetyltransferase component of pyruvate dehydrogenase complex n=1 Tax=Crepidotus variabilis TaxID=179855 RepID=A0A9P6EF98_9AGAR|nr:2-oxoacid dehydrogenases acyltransferase-domain-containing protein [Crepidotus variabilis]
MITRPLARFLLGRPSSVTRFHTSAFLLGARTLQKFKLADIGEGITECEIVKWNVKLHDTVQAFDPLCEVQSDKASVEITSPFDGVVKELLVQEGEVAKVGSGLCLIEVEEDAMEGADPSVMEPLDKSSKETPKEQSAPPTPSPPEPAVDNVPATNSRRLHPMDPSNAQGSKLSSSSDVLAPPSVRHFAREKGVDLGLLTPGSGKDGRIEKRDIESYLSRGTSRPEEQPKQPRSQGEDAIVELGRTRYGMWKAMVKSLEIPHFGYSTTLDITELNNILPILNTHVPQHYLPEGTRSKDHRPQSINPSAVYPAPSSPQLLESQKFSHLTFLPILLKTLSKAMIEWPLFRASITPGSSEGANKPTLTIRPNADISIALSTPSGLYTPTIQSVNNTSIYSLASHLKHLSSLGRQTPSGLTPKEMPKRGGTITVSNVGAIGQGEFASPVLVPGGGVAIVAIGRAKWEWDVSKGADKGERRLKLGVSWSGDHRVVEGAELAAFVECWRSYVEAPQRLIAEGV